MIHVQVSAEDREKIKVLRREHPNPRVRQRLEVLWFKCQNHPHWEICETVGISQGTMRNYFRLYQTGGLEKLLEFNFHTPVSDLEQHRELLAAYFREHPPRTINEAIFKIEDLTGLKRSHGVVGPFLHSLGMSPRKVGSIPSKANPVDQENFKINKLDPILEEAKQGERIVFFVDAAHFVLGPFLGFLWSFERLFVKASAGRKRFNVLAALNAITHELIMITNDSYINAESFCALLREIAIKTAGLPVTLVLDNARYQKCHIVIALAAQLNIHLLYLPPYSPNLNLIERLWKFVKKEVLYCKYYPDFKLFKQAIEGCLSQTSTVHKDKLDSLLALNFQAFKKCKIVPI